MSGRTGGRVDVLVVSLGTTKGLRVADRGFAELVRRAGASVRVVAVRIGATNALRRGYPVNDLVEALAARRAMRTALARERPRAVVISTTTAALLAPPLEVPHAIRFDALARLNRPGARNAVLHALERARLARATLLLPTSATAVADLPPGAARPVVVPFSVAASRARADDGPRERAAAAYVPDPKAKGLDLLCAAWNEAAVPGARLDVFGLPPDVARAHLARCGVPEPATVRWHGLVPVERFRRALRTTLVYANAARWEDFGLAQLEAMADGALLVTAPSGGPFEALELARRLAPELVAPDHSAPELAAALRRAFDLPPEAAARLRAAARAELDAYTPERTLATVRDEVLPALLG